MMRRFILEISAVIVLISGCFTLIEWRFQEAHTMYDDRFSELESRYTEISRINIGNSHIGVLKNYGVDSLSCINLSFGGQDIYHAYSVLKTCIPKMKNLKTIVFGLDYELLGYDFRIANELWRDRQYYSYTNMLYDHSPGNIIQAQSAFFRANKDFRILENKGDEDPSTAYLPLFREITLDDCHERAREHSVYKYNQELTEKNLEYLRQIISICTEAGIQLYLITTPRRSCYYDAFKPEVAEIGKRKIETLQLPENVHYFNFWKSTKFSDKDFLDSDHLNKNGVRKLLHEINL